MQFVLFHGSFIAPPWFSYLESQLDALNQEVLVPKFPLDTWEKITNLGPNHLSEIQNLDNWTEVFEKEVLPKLSKNKPLCFIGHSLGPLFILHMVTKYNLQLDSALFVAPFLDTLDTLWQINVVNKSFYKRDFDFTLLKQLIPLSYAIFSNNDPYVPINNTENFVEGMKCSPICVKGSKHFNADAGYDRFPLIVDLCKTRIG